MGKRIIAKARVSAYTRKDGTFVKEHDNGRQEAAPKVAAPKRRKGAPSPTGPTVFDHADAVVKFAAEYKAAHGDGDDAAKFFCAGQEMKAGDFDALKETIASADTFQTEHILQHIHPSLWESLGCSPSDMKRAMTLYEKKFPKAEESAATGKSETAKKKRSSKSDVTVRSNNEGYGFHGEAQRYAVRMHHGEDASFYNLRSTDREQVEVDAAHSFSRAARHLVDNGHFSSNDAARDFLDSRHGRHLHDASFEHGGDISKTKHLKSCVNAYLKETGQTVKPPSLKEHSNYDPDDYTHLRGHGLDDKAIRAVWDRDAKRGHGPLKHGSVSKVGGTLSKAISPEEGNNFLCLANLPGHFRSDGRYVSSPRLSSACVVRRKK